MSLDALLFQQGGRCFYCGQRLQLPVWSKRRKEEPLRYAIQAGLEKCL
jgi:hypothetical protein